ncbi:MAG: hypothetical protein KGK09_15695 [Burkholderiales bacterium]|nr:hypothetical protein [Burkholderiales bacterium]
MAVLLTLLPLVALLLQRGPPRAVEAAGRLFYLVILPPAARPAPASVPVSLPVPAPVPAPTRGRRAAPALPALVTGVITATPLADTLHAETPLSPAAEPAASAASAPLRLDARVLRAANQAGKGPARRMAERSGAYFGDAPATQAERLARGVAETAKPDCLQPGGSLLSVFVVAYRLARDKCK